MNQHKTAAVLACAGSGHRMRGSCEDKLLLNLAGLPVVVRSLLAYENSSSIDMIVVATKKESLDLYRSFKVKYGFKKEYIVVEGGSTRMESVLKGVKAVPTDYAFVAIGDGARPLIRREEIDATVRAAMCKGAAALGCHISDTVKKVINGTIITTVPREELVSIQTPQVFSRAEYCKLAAEAAGLDMEFTDDASIFEHFGEKVAFVEGRRDNIKITVPEDIALLTAILEEQE